MDIDLNKRYFNSQPPKVDSIGKIASILKLTMDKFTQKNTFFVLRAPMELELVNFYICSIDFTEFFLYIVLFDLYANI